MPRFRRRLAIGTAIAGLALVAATVGLADAAFTDPRGDTAGPLDVTDVRIAVSQAGVLTTSIAIPSSKLIPENEVLGLAIDVDQNQATGASGGWEYYWYVIGAAGGQSSFAAFRWNGTAWVSHTLSSYSASGVDFGVSISFNLSEIGSPKTIRFYVYTRRSGGDDVERAPNTGFWEASVAVGDTTAPSAVGVLTAQAVSSTSVRLTWGRSTDNVGVAAYNIRRNGTPVADVTGTRYVDTGLKPGTRYTYAVTAIDAEGNSSAAKRVSVTTKRIAKSIVFGAKNTLPSLPRVGERFSIGVAMYVREGGKQSRIRSGSVDCRASINSKRVPPVLVGVTPGKGVQCAWNVPANARGATLVVRITVRSAGVAATKTYRWRVT